MTRHGMGRRQTVTADEVDAVSRYWRRCSPRLQRPGVTARTKRKIRRRERHQARQAIKEDQ